MGDQYDDKQRPARQPGEARKSDKGPHGGGVKYTQAKLGGDFIAIPPITGHKQVGNIKPPKG